MVAYVQAIDTINSWDRSAELWKARTAQDQAAGRFDRVPRHQRAHYRALSVKLTSLRKLARQQLTLNPADNLPYTDDRSRNNTTFTIQITLTELRQLEPIIPSEDIARRLFPALDNYPSRLRAHIVESCSKLQEEFNPEDNTAEEQLIAELTNTIRLFQRSQGADFRWKPLAQDIARRSRRLKYRREKTLPDRGILRTWNKPSGPGGRVPLNRREQAYLFQAPPTPSPVPAGRIEKFYGWITGRGVKPWLASP